MLVWLSFSYNIITKLSQNSSVTTIHTNEGVVYKHGLTGTICVTKMFARPQNDISINFRMCFTSKLN